MRAFWIGCGLIAVLGLVVLPHVSNERCKNGWEPMKLEAYFDWQVGCVVKVGGNLGKSTSGSAPL